MISINQYNTRSFVGFYVFFKNCGQYLLHVHFQFLRKNNIYTENISKSTNIRPNCGILDAILLKERTPRNTMNQDFKKLSRKL